MTPRDRMTPAELVAMTACYAITALMAAMILFPVEFRAFILGMFQ